MKAVGNLGLLGVSGMRRAACGIGVEMEKLKHEMRYRVRVGMAREDQRHTTGNQSVGDESATMPAWQNA